MNDRMFELYKQAHLSYTAIDPSNGTPYEASTFSANEFAELIIQKCIMLVDSTPIAYDDYRKQIEKEMRDDCRDRLKNHFGVE
jgi:hypothetical protein